MARRKTSKTTNPPRRATYTDIAGFLTDSSQQTLKVGDRVSIPVTLSGKDGLVKSKRSGRVVALDQVAVIIDGEQDARAVAPADVVVE